MGLRLRDPYSDYLTATQPRDTRASVEHANLGNASLNQVLSPFPTAAIYSGIVVRSGVGVYDAVVLVPGFKHAVVCLQATHAMGMLAGYGHTHSSLLVEGVTVLVYACDQVGSIGFILAVVPPLSTPFNNKPITDQLGQLEMEPGAGDTTETAYRTVYDNNNRLMAQGRGDRPGDLFPGDVAWLNELGVGMAVRRLMLMLKATERCKLELFLPDDLMRMVSGQFQHLSAIGEQHIYNSNGNVTLEFGGSSHQCEVQGYPTFAAADSMKDLGAANVDFETRRQARYELTQPDTAMLRRFQMLLGHLGGLVQFYVTQPDSSAVPSTYAGTPKDNGLMQFGIDGSGRLLVRSASDIIIQRSDRIPVPHKLKEPWDPSGDGYKEESAKIPFKWNTDQYAHPLQQRDALSWYIRQQYETILDNSTVKGKKDWYLPEEVELVTPKDQYDTVVQHKEEFAANAGKTCEVVLRKDGGLTLRNGDGAEISLVGGKVIISAPEGVELRAGKSIIATAGDDVVMKARNSVDITATEKDVRLKAEHNLHAYSARGMLLESAGETEGQGYAGGSGEQVASYGIMLKAPKSRIFVWGQTLHLAAAKNILLEALDAATGALVIGVRTVLATARQFVLATKNSSLILNEGAANLIGSSANLIGDRSAGVFRGDHVAVPMTYSRLERSPYTGLAEQITPAWTKHQQDTVWLQPYDLAQREDFKFTYRTEAQYGTVDVDFAVYESLWAYVARQAGRAVKWEEPLVNATAPWPGAKFYPADTGADADDAKGLVQLKNENNISDAVTGVRKKYLERKAEGGTLERKPFNEYMG